MKTITKIILVFAILGVLHAEEEKPKFDEFLGYKNVTVTRIRPDSIQIVHESGVKTIPFENIPDDVRAKLGLNQEDAETHRVITETKLEIAADNAKKVQFVKENRVVLSGEILQVLDDGVLLRDGSYTDGTKREVKKPMEIRTKGSALHPGTSSVTRYTSSEWVLKQTHIFEPIAVSCDTRGLVDGGEFSGVVFKYGTHTYKTMRGDTKTVPAFTSDLRDALARVGLEL